MEKENEQFVAGRDNESFNSPVLGSVKECIDFMILEADSDVGDSIYIGNPVKISLGQLIDVDILMEQMNEKACDEVGEYAEDYLDDVGSEFRDELLNLIANWFEEKGLAPTFYSVDNVQHYEVVAGGTAVLVPKGQACL